MIKWYWQWEINPELSATNLKGAKVYRIVFSRTGTTRI